MAWIHSRVNGWMEIMTCGYKALSCMRRNESRPASHAHSTLIFFFFNMQYWHLADLLICCLKSHTDCG